MALDRPNGVAPDGETDEVAERLLRAIAPDGWRRIDLTVRMTSEAEEFQLSVLMADGSTPEVDPPAELAPLFRSDRRACYDPVGGTWFSVRLLIDAESDTHYVENYDYDPLWIPPIPREAFLRDLEVFPRAPHRMRDWLSGSPSGNLTAEEWPRGDDGWPYRYQPFDAGAGKTSMLLDVGQGLMLYAPTDWATLMVRHQAVGRHREAFATVFSTNGFRYEWEIPTDLAERFEELRQRTQEPDGTGSWTSCDLMMKFDGQMSVDYSSDEPKWATEPTPADYRLECDLFKSDYHRRPEWLQHKAPPPGEVLRRAHAFDGIDADGNPVVNRPRLEPDEMWRILDYLGRAGAAGGDRNVKFPDLVASDQIPVIAAEVWTDGEWLWPAAVPYYLEKYGLAPENDFLTHIRATNYTRGSVPERLLWVAREIIDREGGVALAQRLSGTRPENVERH